MTREAGSEQSALAVGQRTDRLALPEVVPGNEPSGSHRTPPPLAPQKVDQSQTLQLSRRGEQNVYG